MKGKRYICLLLLITLVIQLLPLPNKLNMNFIALAADGVAYSGQTQKGTYTISTSQQLKTLSQKVNNGTTYEGSTFVLQNDIDFGKQDQKNLNAGLTVNFTPIGTMDHPFMGTLDGNNKMIRNIVIVAPDYIGVKVNDVTDAKVYVGFIGHLKNGVVKNVRITAFRQTEIVSNKKIHGILVGVNDGLIENCYIDKYDEHTYYNNYYNDGRYEHIDKVAKSMVWINKKDIINCHNEYSFIVEASSTNSDSGILQGCAGIATYNYGNIKACSNIAQSIKHVLSLTTKGYGGIVYENYGQIENSFNTANIAGFDVAGIVYKNYEQGKVLNCYNTGDVISTDVGAAGVVGFNNGLIERCYNTGTVGGEILCCGGITQNNNGTIRYSYNTGIVSGYLGYNYSNSKAYMGGISGYISNGVIEYSYNIGKISGMFAGGLVGESYGSFTIKGCYNAGIVNTLDPPVDEWSNYPVEDGFKNNGGLVGYNMKNYNIDNRPAAEYKREVEEIEVDIDIELDNIRDFCSLQAVNMQAMSSSGKGKLVDYGLYLGSYDLTNITNTYYCQYETNYSASGHVFMELYDSRESFTDIHGTDKTLGKTIEQMQSKEFVNQLNLGDIKVYVQDTGTEKINNGFPIFKWQQKISSIEIVGTATIEEGLYQAFSVKVTPAEITGTEFTWKIADESIIRIEAFDKGRSAIIYGLKVGVTNITVTANDKGKTSTIKSIRVVYPTVQTKAGYYLIGEEIEYNSSYYDEEGDPLYRKELKYVHDDKHLSDAIPLDNSLGTVSYNKNWLGDSVNTFSKVGRYDIYIRSQDNPPTANTTGFEKYRYYSGEELATIYIHRKPVASYTISNNRVIDESYDLDHSNSSKDKGIIKWEWSYVNSNGFVDKCISTDYLDKGLTRINTLLETYKGVNYELILRVQDMEYVWSDICGTTVKGELNMTANLRAELSEFDLVTGVPASENLLAFDVWTKYHKDVKLELLLCDISGNAVASKLSVPRTAAYCNKIGEEIYWKDIKYNIPRKLKGDNYILKIKAIDVTDESIYKEMSFNVKVKTPINLQPDLKSSIKAGEETTILAKTSKYVNNAYSPSGVNVVMFEGTSYARAIILNGSHTDWQIKKTFEKSIPSGTYKAKFTATLPSNEYEAKVLDFNYIANTPPVIDDVSIYADVDSSYIYENDDVSMTLKCHDDDLTKLNVKLQLYKSTNLSSPIKTITKTVSPSGGTYNPLAVKLIDDIIIGNYKVVTTITDDSGETATLSKDLTAHDLWVTGSVAHTVDWENNRQSYNAKYPSKTRSIDTYWNGEALETSANTTIIDVNSKDKCTKVSVEIINNDAPADDKYLKWLNDAGNNELWKLTYFDKAWVSRGKYVIIKWGQDKKQELTLKFTAHFNNEWIETYTVKIYIDSRDDYWKLHRAW